VFRLEDKNNARHIKQNLPSQFFPLPFADSFSFDHPLPPGDASLLSSIMSSPVSLPLCLASYNIYNTTSRYTTGRSELLSKTISSIPYDIMGLQEVALPEQLAWITSSTQKASSTQKDPLHEEEPLQSFPAPLKTSITDARDPTFKIDGNAFLLLPSAAWSPVPGSHEVLHLSPDRVVQKITLRHATENTTCVVANTHLHWCSDPLGLSTPADAVIRLDQLQSALEFVSSVSNPDANIIVLGDFNSYTVDHTEEKIQDVFSDHGFTSCFEEILGHNPVTVPTRLQAPTIIPESSIEQRADAIFFRPSRNHTIQVLSAQLEEGLSSTDGTLCASDHFALIANITITPKRP